MPYISIDLPPEAPSQAITDPQVLPFKKFLKSLGRYNGVINNIADPIFIEALKQLEIDISNAIKPKSVIGLIWKGDRINPATSVEDVANALRILEQRKLNKSAEDINIAREYILSVHEPMGSGWHNKPAKIRKFKAAGLKQAKHIASELMKMEPDAKEWRLQNPHRFWARIAPDGKLLFLAENRESVPMEKGAQATVDTFDVEEYQEAPPSAMKPHLTMDDTGIEAANPDDSQQQGRTQQQIPASLASIDDRVIEFSKILYDF